MLISRHLPRCQAIYLILCGAWNHLKGWLPCASVFSLSSIVSMSSLFDMRGVLKAHRPRRAGLAGHTTRAATVSAFCCRRDCEKRPAKSTGTYQQETQPSRDCCGDCSGDAPFGCPHLKWRAELLHWAFHNGKLFPHMGHSCRLLALAQQKEVPSTWTAAKQCDQICK